MVTMTLNLGDKGRLCDAIITFTRGKKEKGRLQVR